jgi:ATP-dependent RNA helicase DDX52/ROK1
MDTIFDACSSPTLQRSLFSATMPSAIETLAKSFLRDPIRVLIGQAYESTPFHLRLHDAHFFLGFFLVLGGHRNAATSTIDQKLVYVGSEAGKLIEIRQMVSRGGLRPPALLFVQSIERAMELFHELVYDGIRVDVIHSERTKAQRDCVVERFRSVGVFFLPFPLTPSLLCCVC